MILRGAAPPLGSAGTRYDESRPRPGCRSYVDLGRLELPTPCMPCRCATSCATGPWLSAREADDNSTRLVHATPSNNSSEGRRAVRRGTRSASCRGAVGCPPSCDRRRQNGGPSRANSSPSAEGSRVGRSPPALRAVVDFDAIAVAHHEKGVVSGAFHGPSMPGHIYASTGCSPRVSGMAGQSFQSRSSE